jgi:hypothetical protein
MSKNYPCDECGAESVDGCCDSCRQLQRKLISECKRLAKAIWWTLRKDISAWVELEGEDTWHAGVFDGPGLIVSASSKSPVRCAPT